MQEFVDNFDGVPTKEQKAQYKKEHVDPKTLFQKGTIPTCIWTKNNHTTSKDYIGWHPTTKNIDILKRMILGYTNEGDTVLDVFMGSSATAVAAIRTGRNYLGCEADKEYFDLSNERIKKVIDEPESFEKTVNID